MTDQPQGGKPALTVVVQSWWTPALAVIMLVAGLLVGYFIRPLINKDTGTASTGEVAALTTPVPTNSVAQITSPTSTVDPTVAAITSKEQLMAYLVSNTTHFKGDPNAKVTIIEFSDYQ
jgi:protein-disulfide isomerase